MAKMIKDLPVGAKVKFGKSHYFPNVQGNLKWIIVSKNSKWCNNGVTLFSEYAIDYRYLDYTSNTANYPMSNYGDNIYNQSHIHEWLNSDASPGNWCKTSKSPAQYDEGKTAGFLYNFTSEEKQSILISNIFYTGQEELERLSAKVYLPSAEVFRVPLIEDRGNRTYATVDLQDRWDIYLSNNKTTTVFESNLKSYLRPPDNNFKTRGTICRNVPGIKTYIEDKDLKKQIMYCCFTMAITDSSGGMTDHVNAKDQYGIRPVLNVNANTKVSNTTDSEGYYTIVFNTPPSKPTSLRATTTKVFGGKTLTLTWDASTDDDGDAIKYVLQRKVNNGSWTTLSSSHRNTRYTDSITFGWNTVQYRVAAYDFDIPTDDASFTTSDTYSIVNNVPPTISGSDRDLGASSTGITISYTVNDADSDSVTVRTSVDNKDISNTRVTLGNEYKINLTGDAWVSLRNGRHTVRIEASDSVGNVATRTYTFIKSVTQLIVSNKVAYPAKSMPGRIKVYVNRQIPTGADFKVLVCNNGFDTSPTWEDATQSVTTNLVHVFNNKSKTASQWGVKIKVIANRKNTSGECYISEIGGNFE